MGDKDSGLKWCRVCRLDVLFGITLTILCAGNVFWGGTGSWKRAEPWIWLGFAISWVGATLIQILELRSQRVSWADFASTRFYMGIWWVVPYDFGMAALYLYLR